MAHPGETFELVAEESLLPELMFEGRGLWSRGKNILVAVGLPDRRVIVTCLWVLVEATGRRRPHGRRMSGIEGRHLVHVVHVIIHVPRHFVLESGDRIFLDHVGEEHGVEEAKIDWLWLSVLYVRSLLWNRFRFDFLIFSFLVRSSFAPFSLFVLSFWSKIFL